MFKEESAEEMRPSTRKSWVCRSTGQQERARKASFTGFLLDLER